MQNSSFESDLTSSIRAGVCKASPSAPFDRRSPVTFHQHEQRDGKIIENQTGCFGEKCQNILFELRTLLPDALSDGDQVGFGN